MPRKMNLYDDDPDIGFMLISIRMISNFVDI